MSDMPLPDSTAIVAFFLEQFRKINKSGEIPTVSCGMIAPEKPNRFG